MHSAEKFLSEAPVPLRRNERACLNVNERSEMRHHAQTYGVREEHVLRAVELAGISERAVHAHLGC